MDQRPIDNLIARQMPALRAVSVGFVASILLYIGLAWVLVNVVLLEPLLNLSFAVAGGVAASQLLVILAGYLVSGAIRGGESESARAGASARRGPGAPRRSPADVAILLQRYTRSVVVAAAMREVAGVVGLLLTLFTGDILWVVFLGGVALFSTLVHWPRRAAVDDWLQQQGISI